MVKEVVIALFASVLSMAGCRPDPPPSPPPIPSVPPPPSPVPPVPSASVTSALPACQALEEKCVAGSSARVSFGQHGTSFLPPPRWIYAKEATQSLTMPADGGAVVAFSDGAGETPELLWATFHRMFDRLSVTGVEKKGIQWTKPGARWSTDAVEVKVWEIEQPKPNNWSPQRQDPLMKGEPGSLLLAVSQIDDRVVVGLAFLARRAPVELVGPIRASIESLQKR